MENLFVESVISDLHFGATDPNEQYKILKEVLPDKKRAIQINNLFNWLKDNKNKSYVISKQWIAKKNIKFIKFTKLNIS